MGNKDKDLAKERLQNAQDKKERDRLNKLFKEKNEEIIKTLWQIGLHFRDNGQTEKAKNNLIEALDLAIEIEGRRTVEGGQQSFLGSFIENDLDYLLSNE